MRCGYPLKYFKGNSKSYVFVGSFPTKECMIKYKKGKKLKDPSDYEEYVEDYGDNYRDNASFCELIGTIVGRETNDKEYAEKIMKILAKKLRVEHKLRKKPLTTDQWFDLTHKNLMKFKKSKEGKRLFKLIGGGSK